MLAIRLPEEIEARLDRLAKRTGRSKTFYAREAILHHLDAFEDLYLAEQVARRIENGEEGTSTLDDVEARLGLADSYRRTAHHLRNPEQTPESRREIYR